LKFSTRNEEFNGESGFGQWAEERIRRKANEIDGSRAVKMRMDFGDAFAYKDDDAQPGKSGEGEQR
jgi:hypothetical protein